MALELLVVFFLILLNGFFSLSEMAIVASRKARLKHEADLGKRNYRLALETAENPSRFLSTIQVAITLIGTLAGAFGGVTVAKGLEENLGAIPAFEAIARPLAVGIVVVLTTLFSVVLGELVPKSIALAKPEAVAAAIIGPVRLFAVIFYPFARFLAATTDLVASALGVKKGQEPAVTEAEVRVLIAKGEETGVFEHREREMVEGVLSLGDRRVTSLMTPRTDIVSVDLGDELDAIKAAIVENARYGYLPAIDGDIDRCVGFLPVKVCLAAIAEGRFSDPRAHLRDSFFIPESVSALKAFALLKAGDVESALILDEYGGVAGLVTLFDLIEAMVGDIPGAPEEEPEIVARPDGSFLADGSLGLEQFVQQFHLGAAPAGDYDTIAGLVLDRMGKIPRPGDRCTWEDFDFEVLDMDGNRIDKLLIVRKPEGEPGEAED